MQTASFEVRYGTLYVLSWRKPLTGVYLRITVEGAGSRAMQFDLFNTVSLGGSDGCHLLSTDAGIRGHAVKQGLVYNGEPVFNGLWKSYDYGWISLGASNAGPAEPFVLSDAECTGYYSYQGSGATGFPGLGNADAGDGIVWHDLSGDQNCGTEELRIVGTEWRNGGTVSRVSFQGMEPNFCGLYKPMNGGSDDDAKDVVLGNLVLKYSGSRDIPVIRTESGSGWMHTVTEALAGDVDKLRIVTPVGGPSDSVDGAYAVERDNEIIALCGKGDLSGLLTSVDLTDRLRMVVGPGYEEAEEGEDEPAAIDVSADSVDDGSAHVDCVLQENRLMTSIGSASWIVTGIPFLPSDASGTYAASISDSTDYTVFRNSNGYYLKKVGGETVDGMYLEEFYRLYDGSDSPIAHTRSNLATSSGTWGFMDSVKLYQDVDTVLSVEELPETGVEDCIYVLPSGRRMRWLEDPDNAGQYVFMEADSVFEEVSGVYQETGLFGSPMYRDVGSVRYAIDGLTDWYPYAGVAHVALGAVWHTK